MTSSAPNAKQRDEWNEATGSRWLKRHHAIDKQIAPFGHRAMERVAIKSGEHALDIGCGCGETTIDLARRVDPGGVAMGIDISGLLIRAARESARQSNILNVQFEEADAQTCSFSAESFDIAYSRFGVMFFDDPDAAFRNIHSALRPDGRLVFVCWPAPAENLFFTIPMSAAARHITLPAPSDPQAPGPFAFADPNRVSGILSRSRFRQVEIDRIGGKVAGLPIDQAADLLLQLGPLGDVLDSLDDQTRLAIRADIRSALVQFESSGRVLLDASAWLVTARR